jgi:hypothetical protein
MPEEHGEAAEDWANRLLDGKDRSLPFGQEGAPVREAVRLTLTEPKTVLMTEEEYRQAVDALASMIARWWQNGGLAETARRASPTP